LESVRLDQSFRLDHHASAIRRAAHDSHDSVGLVVGLDFPTEEFLDLDTLFDHVEAVGEMVEHFVFRCQVRAVPAQSPFDVSRGEHRMWLV